VQPAAPRRRRVPPRSSLGPASSDDSPFESIGRLSEQLAHTNQLLVGFSHDLARLANHTNALAAAMTDQAERLDRLTSSDDDNPSASKLDKMRRAIDTKIDAALTDLLASLDHELSEHYEQNQIERQHLSDSLRNLMKSDSSEFVAIRNDLTVMDRGLRKQVNERFKQIELRQKELDVGLKTLMAELVALRRRLQLTGRAEPVSRAASPQPAPARKASPGKRPAE
jgi:hypothetical protein